MGLTSAFVGIMLVSPFASSDPSNIVWIPPGISGILEDLVKKRSIFFFFWQLRFKWLCLRLVLGWAIESHSIVQTWTQWFCCLSHPGNGVTSLHQHSRPQVDFLCRFPCLVSSPYKALCKFAWLTSHNPLIHHYEWFLYVVILNIFFYWYSLIAHRSI